MIIVVVNSMLIPLGMYIIMSIDASDVISSAFSIFFIFIFLLIAVLITIASVYIAPIIIRFVRKSMNNGIVFPGNHASSIPVLVIILTSPPPHAPVLYSK